MICELHRKAINFKMTILILDELTFDDLDGSADDLVPIHLLLDGRRVYVFISFARQLQRTLSKLVIGLLFIVHGQIVRLTISLWTLHFPI